MICHLSKALVVLRQLKDRAQEQETTIGSLKEALERMRTEVRSLYVLALLCCMLPYLLTF